MGLARIIRLLLWLVVFAWAAWLLRRLFGASAKRKGPGQTSSASPFAPKQLHRDPWCGTHVSDEISHRLEHAGEMLHFCSAECRDRYLAASRRAASG